MGNKIILSKHTSDLDAMLSLSSSISEKLSLKVDPDEKPKRHLSLWSVTSAPQGGHSTVSLPLHQLLADKSFQLSPKLCYILLIIERINNERPLKNKTLSQFTPLSRILNSAEQLSPRGLEIPFFAHEGKHFKYKIFFLNGKASTEGQRAFTVYKSLELRNWMQANAGFSEPFIYCGYFILNDKVKSGNRVQLVWNKTEPIGPRLNDPALKLVQSIADFSVQKSSTVPKKKGFTKVLNLASKETKLDDSLKRCSSKSTFKLATPKVSGKTGKLQLLSPALHVPGPRPLATKSKLSSSEKRLETKFNLNLKNLNFNLFSDEENESFMGETRRKLLKMEQYENVCSDILKGKMFLAGYKVAKNLRVLQDNGITHIVNCAGDYCPNLFPEQFEYKTYFIKDSRLENIECVFYDACDFIKTALEAKGKVLVHCVQGVSRSVTIVIAYFILKLRMPYHVAFDLIKEERKIASPNIGFLAQLITFQKRIEGKLGEECFPKIFVMGSHQIEDPKTIVARYVS